MEDYRTTNKTFSKGNVKLYNEDNMAIMKDYVDDYFDLAIVDPPYGIEVNKMTLGSGKYKNKKKNWDHKTPDQEYFDELFRISKNQIIFGANYMIDKIKRPSMGWIYWDKMNGDSDFSDGELAYTSFKRALRSFKYHLSKDRSPRFHPTQKPIQLYNFLLKNYANHTDRIIDTHLGGGSVAIACYYYGCKEFVGIEIDPEYFEKAVHRITQQTSQYKLL